MEQPKQAFSQTLKTGCSEGMFSYKIMRDQRAKKVVSDSPGLVDFAIGLVNSVFKLPDGQVILFLGIRITEEL